jgi:hypothetical protein
MCPTALLEKRNDSPLHWKEGGEGGQAARWDFDVRSGPALILTRNERPERRVFIKLSIQARLSDLPGKQYLLRYLSHLYRRNRRPNTLETNFTGIRVFLEFLQREGIAHLEDIPRGGSGSFHRT